MGDAEFLKEMGKRIMVRRKSLRMTQEELSEELGVSKGHAYKMIRKLNEELEASGYIVVSGKIPRAFWEKKFFGYQNAVQTA